MKAIISKGGFITLPAALRRKLKLQSGEALDLRCEEDRIILRKLPRVRNVIEKFAGKLKVDLKPEEMCTAAEARAKREMARDVLH